MDHLKSDLLLVFIVAILISIVGVGVDCISGLDIVVWNSEKGVPLDGVNIYFNGRPIGPAPNGQLYITLPNNEEPLRYKIEAKKMSSSGSYYGYYELTVGCSDSSGVSKSIDIYAKSGRI